MPYTIIVCDDNTLYGSCKRKIMQREKLFNKLWFLFPPRYNGYDMSQCTVTMRYMLPISKEFKTEILVLSNDKYKEYLKYVLPIDTNITKECGDIKLNLTFTMLDKVSDADGNNTVVQRVRKTDNHILTITPISEWDAIVPDAALSALDQRILRQDAQIRTLAELADSINSNNVDSLIYDDVNETLQLSANGVGVGNKVSVRDMIDDGTPVINLGFNSEGSNGDNNSDENNNAGDAGNNGCGCGCEGNHNLDNVVKF